MKSEQVALVFGQTTKPADTTPFVSQYRACLRCDRFHHVSTTCLLCAPLHQTRSSR